MDQGFSEGVGQWRLPLAHAAGTALAGGLALSVQATGGGILASFAVLVLGIGVVALLRQRLATGRQDAMAEIRGALERLARGDTSRRLVPTRLGELSEMGAAVNRVIDVLGGTKQRVGDLSDQLVQLPEQIAAALEAVQRSADDQEAAVEETAALQANINTSISSINSEVEKLAGSNEESASSILQLGSAVEQVARSAAALQETLEASTSSVHQVGESIGTVAASADSVQGVAEETAASITEMDRAIQEVGVHVRGASELTERVSETADEGSRAVGATIEGIAEIREVTLGAKSAIESLAEQIAEIGGIATVIASITDETNLLSLNAAIIAAQAGEHGKAFAVVADQVKELARRTSQSTKEIEQRIEAIREQSGRSVDAMAAGIAAVEQGVERSRVAGDALEAIRDSAHDASGRVAEIARAAEEQARNSKQVAEAARRTSEHVQEISSAMTEQSQVSKQLLDNASTSVDMCSQMAKATEEQRASGRYITSNIESITDMIRSIQRNTRAHEKASAAVGQTFDAILENARQSAARLPELATAVETLRAHASAMSEELTRFGSQQEDSGPDGDAA
jgi:methyl-accepting chemotaxis protein